MKRRRALEGHCREGRRRDPRVHIVARCRELIAEAVLALEYSASAEDLQRTIHATRR